MEAPNLIEGTTGDEAVKRADFLVFIYDGNALSDGITNGAFIIPQVTPERAVQEMSDMEELGFQINGSLQLGNQLEDWLTNGDAPTQRFLVGGERGWSWLHELPIWDQAFKDKLHDNQADTDLDDGRDFTPPYEP